MAVAVAAAAAQAHPSPPPPPPKARRTMSWLACAFVAWTTAICLSVASMWLFSWSLAATEIGWLTCGASCAVMTAALKVFYPAAATLVLAVPFSLLGARMMARAQAAAVVPVAAKAAAAATDIKATKEPVKTCFAAMWGELRALTLKTCYAAMRSALRDPLVLGFLASSLFTLLMFIALRVAGDKPVMGSRRAITCAVIYHVGAVGVNAVDCFVLCPLVTLRVWRFWREARHDL